MGDVSPIERMETRCHLRALTGDPMTVSEDAGHGERCGQWPQDGAKVTRSSSGPPAEEGKASLGSYLFYRGSCYL